MRELTASPPSPGFRSMFESYRLERNLRVKRVKFAANISTKACQNLSSKTAAINRSQITGVNPSSLHYLISRNMSGKLISADLTTSSSKAK